MRQVYIAAAVMLAAGVLAGCELKPMTLGKPEIKAAQPVQIGGMYLEKTAIRDESRAEATSAVDEALEWARKYAEASERHNKTLQENRQLREQHQGSEKQLAEVKLRLGRAEKELAEANAMLLEMRKELDKWKANVLGFRNEMRQAQQVQIDALAKILKLVGGELAPPAQAQSAERTKSEGPGEKL